MPAQGGTGLAVRVFDISKLQIIRLRFEDQESGDESDPEPILEIADPPAADMPMQWVVIRGRAEIARLAHACLEFLMDHPEKDGAEFT